MAEVLLTHAYFLRLDPKQWKTQRPYPPLATLYAAAMLRGNGFDIAFHDMMFAASHDELRARIEQEKPKYLVVVEDGFNYLTKMCLTNMRDAAFRMIALAKQHGCEVIVSGSDSTDHSEQYLRKGADRIIVGEVEQTLLGLMQAYREGSTDHAAIPGLRYLENDVVRSTAKRENLRDLDLLPMPAWDLADLRPYRESWMKSSGYFSLNIGTTRGCPFKCNWCAKPIYGNRYHSRSPENVVAELRMLKQRYAFDHIWFCDDIFGLKPGWVQRFATLLEKEPFRFSFKIQSRVDLLLEDNYLEALKRAGCEEIWVGAESGSQQVLDAMDKGTKVEQIYAATKLMQRKGIKPCFFLQFGYPGETHEDIRKTLDMVFTLMPHDLGISVSYPLPGTVFYERVKDQLKEKANWTDSDELSMMFRNAYPSWFYKKLQRYVHHEYRRRKAVNAWKQRGDLKKALSLALRIPRSMMSKAAIRKYVA